MLLISRQTVQQFTLATIVATLSTSVVALDAAQSADGESQRYLLRYKFKAGEQLRYKMVNNLTQQGMVGKGTKTDKTKIEQKRLFTIREVMADGGARASMQFEHVRMQIQSNGAEPEVYDSSMPADQVPQKFQATADKLAGAAPVYTLQPQGTPVSKEGIEQIPDGGQASFMFPMPESEIAVGDTWKVNMMVTVRMAKGVKRDIALLRTYRLKSVEDGIAKIGFSTSILTPVKSPALKTQLLQATPQGDLTFNIDKGQLLRKEIRVNRMVLGAIGQGTMLSVKGATVEMLVETNGSDDGLSASR